MTLSSAFGTFSSYGVALSGLTYEWRCLNLLQLDVP